MNKEKLKVEFIGQNPMSIQEVIAELDNMETSGKLGILKSICDKYKEKLNEVET